MSLNASVFVLQIGAIKTLALGHLTERLHPKPTLKSSRMQVHYRDRDTKACLSTSSNRSTGSVVCYLSEKRAMPAKELTRKAK